MKIYLDDERTPPNGWKLVKTPKEVIKLLKRGKVTELSLDHDLGDDKNIGTGYDVLLWIEKQVYTKNFKPPKIKVHSANISARNKMELAIKSINKKNESLKLINLLNEITLKSAIDKLKYGETGPYKVKIRVSDLLLSKKSILGAYRDIKQNRPSKTNKLIDVLYDRDKNVLIITDGWHRFVQLLMKGLRHTDYIDVKLSSYPGVNDYYSIPFGDNIFNIKTDVLKEVASVYINESKYIHRWMDDNELLKLLKNKKVASNKKFVSFTLDPMRIRSAGFSGNAVTFNRRNFESLNKAIEVWYDPDFMRLHPDICLYVTGYKGEEDWDEMGFVDWETYILDYEEEQEIVVRKSYKIDKNTIEHIEIPKNKKKKFQQFENEYNIEYD